MRQIIMLSILFLLPVTFAYNVNVVPVGKCREFTIMINTDMQGCWDAKVDAPGQTVQGEALQSTFYYQRNAVCGGYGSFDVMFSSGQSMETVLKLRQNSTIIENSFHVEQKCSEALSGINTLAISLLIIILLLMADFWYKGRK